MLSIGMVFVGYAERSGVKQTLESVNVISPGVEILYAGNAKGRHFMKNQR